MRIASLLLLLAFLSIDLQAQQLNVYPSPQIMQFPGGYDIIDADGKVVKQEPDQRQATIQAHVDHEGQRYFISDWSFARMRDRGIRPNLIRPRQHVPEVAQEGLEQLAQEIIQRLPRTSALAFHKAFEERFTGNSNPELRGHWIKDLREIKAALESSESQLSRLLESGVPYDQVEAIREYIYYETVTSIGRPDWETSEKIFERLSKTRSETSTTSDPSGFPRPSIRRQNEEFGNKIDWSKGWARQTDEATAKLRQSPHPVIQTADVSGGKIASEVRGRKFVARSFVDGTSVFVFDAVSDLLLGEVNPEAMGFSLRDDGYVPINLILDDSESFLAFNRFTEGYVGGVTYVLNLKTWEMGATPFAFPVFVRPGVGLHLLAAETESAGNLKQTIVERGAIISLADSCEGTGGLKRESVDKLLKRFRTERDRKLILDQKDSRAESQGNFIEPLSGTRFLMNWHEVFGEKSQCLDLGEFTISPSTEDTSPATTFVRKEGVPRAVMSAPCFKGALFEKSHSCEARRCAKDLFISGAFRSRNGRWWLPVFEFDRGVMPSGWQYLATIGAWDTKRSGWVALPAFGGRPLAPFALDFRGKVPLALPDRISKINAPYPHHFLDERDGQLWISGIGDVLTCSDLENVEAIRRIKGIPTFQFFSVVDDLIIGVPDSRIPMMELWSHVEGKKLLTLFPDKTGSFLAISPDGYFATRGASRSHVVFRLDDRAFHLDQFDAKFNRPDLILEALGAGDEERTRYLAVLANRRLERVVEAESVDVPVIEFESTPSVEGGLLGCTVRTAAGSKPPARIRAEINGVPVWGGLADPGVTRLSVPLSNGENRLRVYGETENGISSVPLEARFAQDLTAPTKRFVVAIGVSRYEAPGMDLEFSRKDANDIVEALSDKGAETEVLLFEDERFSIDSLGEISAFLAKASIHDEVILFLAGHGVLNKDYQYYFAPSDMDFDSPELRGVPFDRLETILASVAARKRLMLIDTCHAGHIDPEENERLLALASNPGEDDGRRSSTKIRAFAPAPVSGVPAVGVTEDVSGLSAAELAGLREFFPDFSHRDGITVFAASGGAEFAWEEDLTRNGLFTHAILRSLSDRAADSDGDGKITVPELLKAAAPKVTELSKGLQHPSSRGVNLIGDFVLSRVRP